MDTVIEKKEASITLKELLSYSPCYSEEEITAITDKTSMAASEISKLPIDEKDKIWVLTRTHFLDKRKAVRFAIACARMVLDIYEKKYPNDSRPRKAIEAAEEWLINPTDTRAAGAGAAGAAAAYAAGAAAAYAAGAAAAYAAYAAAAAAYAAGAAAAYAAYAAGAADAAYAAAAGASHEIRVKQLAILLEIINGDE